MCYIVIYYYGFVIFQQRMSVLQFVVDVVKFEVDFECDVGKVFFIVCYFVFYYVYCLNVEFDIVQFFYCVVYVGVLVVKYNDYQIGFGFYFLKSGF